MRGLISSSHLCINLLVHFLFSIISVTTLLDYQCNLERKLQGCFDDISFGALSSATCHWTLEVITKLKQNKQKAGFVLPDMGRVWYSEGRTISTSKSKRQSNETNGCITALSHFFHFHHFNILSRHHHPQPNIDSPSRNPKGLVAPRNSLELTEESSLSTNYIENKSLHIPVGGTRSKFRDLLVDTSSDICNSPRVKTPNVVARLMGLDLLPDNLELNKSSRMRVRGQRLSENVLGTRSLPVSPRISSARESDSDIRRLSLQLIRENKHEEFGSWRLKELKREEESRSPRHKGRQIVNRTKERVITRRVGMDITNLVENRKTEAAQNQIELRKVRSRFSQKENTTSTKPTFVLRQDRISLTQTKANPINERKKADCESKLSFHPTHNNSIKQRRAFVSTSTHSKSDRRDPLEKKKCKKIPKSNDIFNISETTLALSATERQWKEMEGAKEPERNADTTICSGYRYEEKIPQEHRSSNLVESTTIWGSTEIDFEYLPGMKKVLEQEEEEKRVVAEIERHIIDALILETVKITFDDSVCV